MPKKLVIIGAGGVGREIAAVLSRYPLSDYEFIGFIDDNLNAGDKVNGVDVIGTLKWVVDNDANLGVIIAIGNPVIRESIVSSLKGLRIEFPTVIHPGAKIHDKNTVAVAKGCYIADGCILTVNIIVEEFCFINTACTIQHDATIGSFSVLMPGVRITGGATIGKGVYVASNKAITTNLTIQDYSILD